LRPQRIPSAPRLVHGARVGRGKEPLTKRWLKHRSHRRIIVMALVGVVAGVASALLGAQADAPAIGWDAACITYVVWAWVSVRRLDDDQTRKHATREDPSRASADILLIIASIVSLGAIGVSLVTASSGNSVDKALAPAL